MIPFLLYIDLFEYFVYIEYSFFWILREYSVYFIATMFCMNNNRHFRVSSVHSGDASFLHDVSYLFLILDTKTSVFYIREFLTCIYVLPMLVYKQNIQTNLYIIKRVSFDTHFVNNNSIFI